MPGIPVGKIPRHRQLIFRILRQGDTDGIADAFGQQGGNRHAGLDASGIAVSGFRNADVQGKDDAPLLHHPGKFPVCFDHDDRIAGLQGDDDIVKLRIQTHVDPFHRRQGHGLRSVSVAFHDIGSQGTVIQADPDGRSIFLALLEETGELTPRLFMVLMEVARVDPDLLHDRRHGNGRFGGEMDVGNQGDTASCRPETRFDLPDMRHILQAGNGNPHQLRTGGRQPKTLGHRRIDIVRMGIAHRLDDDRVVSSDEDVTYFDYSCFHVR